MFFFAKTSIPLPVPTLSHDHDNEWTYVFEACLHAHSHQGVLPLVRVHVRRLATALLDATSSDEVCGKSGLTELQEEQIRERAE